VGRRGDDGPMNAEHLKLCSSAEWADAVQRWILPWVLDGVTLGPDVLEVGPGPGLTTDVLRERVPRLTAVEIDPELAGALAERLAGTNVDVVKADATDTGLESGRFSAAVCLTMLHHVPTAEGQDALFAEVHRLLRPGGVLAGEDSLDSPEFRDLHRGDTCVPVGPDGLAARLTAAGFVGVRVDTNEYAVRFQAKRRAGRSRRKTAPIPSSPTLS
jgi:SAM-dependent methyltransferase